MSDLAGDLIFEGTDGEDSVRFAQAIRKRAFAEGKLRDDQWMADLAATCFVGDAFDWFDGLDEEVQASWKLLRPALLSRYGKSGTKGGLIASTSGDHIPTPAAAPPLPAFPTSNPLPETNAIGRLKFVSQSGVSKGWLHETPRGYTVTESSSDALYVRYLRDARRLEAINSTTEPKAGFGIGRIQEVTESLGGGGRRRHVVSTSIREFDVLAEIRAIENGKRPGLEWSLSSDCVVTPFHVDIDGTRRQLTIYIKAVDHVGGPIFLNEDPEFIPARLILESV